MVNFFACAKKLLDSSFLKYATDKSAFLRYDGREFQSVMFIYYLFV